MTDKMADFEAAYNLTNHNEGGYANNPSDHGGETIFGIARNFWPGWAGWKIIDAIKEVYGTDPKIINERTSREDELQLEKQNFYKQNFWDANSLDAFKDQQLANSIYDFGINSGTKKAAKTLQQVCGIIVDGQIGGNTLLVVNNQDASELLQKYNQARKNFYFQLASNPTQHQFLASWLSRLIPYQS